MFRKRLFPQERNAASTFRYRYGIPETESPLAICTTLWDKTRAPEGKHCLYFYHFEPYNLKDGGPEKWDEIGEEICWGMMDEFRKFTG